jgi:trimethylamine:corrinoid methyltransferase-like protein
MPLKPKLEVISVDDFKEIHQATMKLFEETGITERTPRSLTTRPVSKPCKTS